MAERLLIVEPDARWVARLEGSLSSAGYGITTVRLGSVALLEVGRQLPDLVVTEVDLLDAACFELTKRVRADPSTASIPILVVSARTDTSSRIAALEAGVDDYVTKPFSSRELVLRVAALLRRAQQPKPPSMMLHVGRIDIDVAHQRVSVDGDEVTLTPLEFRLVHYLASEPGHVRGRGELLERIWGLDAEGGSRTVDTHIKRLRRKLAKAHDHIQTIVRVGYRLRAP